MKFKVMTEDRSYTTDGRRREAMRGLRLMARLGRMAQRALDALERDGHYDGVAPYVPPRRRGLHFMSATAASSSYTFDQEPVEKNFVMATFPLPVEPTLDWISDISNVHVKVHRPLDANRDKGRAYAVAKIVGTVRAWKSREGVALVEATRGHQSSYLEAQLAIGQVSFNFKDASTIDEVIGFHCPGTKSFTRLDDLKPHLHEVLAAAFIQTNERDVPHEMCVLQDVAAKWFKDSGHADFVFETIREQAHDILVNDLNDMTEAHLVTPVMEE